MKWLCVLCMLCGLRVCSFALDREAFTFTDYNLHVRVEPEQQRIQVRGSITLRNDSEVPQQTVDLQISSSLAWRSIKLDTEPLEFISQSYASDIDHTGALSEAIVTLPKEVPPKGIVKLVVGYEGVIPSNTTRLTRIGIPEKRAKATDWDRISTEFTAVRGVGYVVWYPVATEFANLSEGSSAFETIARWKIRHADSSMSILFESTIDESIFFSGNRDGFVVAPEPGIAKVGAYSILRFGINVPIFVMANYKSIAARNTSSIHYLQGSYKAAKSFAEFLTNLDFLFVARKENALQVLELPDAAAAPFVSEPLMLTPLNSPITPDTELNLVYAVARQAENSYRAWIHDGLAHYAQLRHIEEANGRQTVLGYLDSRLALLSEPQKTAGPKTVSSIHEASDSLINSGDDPKSQIKAMWVWWMLHDMCGESIVPGTMVAYQATADKEPSYIQHLIESSCKKDLEWFFDDWVYRDKGLPDFHVAAVFPRKNLKEGYLTSVTIENLGNAGAEVPVTIHGPSGDITERLIVKGKSQATVRFTTPGIPDLVTVNDGSVPESDITNNTFKIEPTTADTH